MARRDLVARTRLSGHVRVRINYTFETSNCRICGSLFLRECGRCHSRVFAPVTDRCENCGLPHPWAADRLAATRRAQPRQWRPGSKTNSPALLLAEDLPGQIYVIQGDVTTFVVDAVVSNDDVAGRMWAAVASSIKAAGGPDIETESVSWGPYPLGTAWVTDGGGTLRARKVIHVAAMDRQGMSHGIPTIQACVRAALNKANEEQVNSLAVATIGTGTQAIALKKWLERVSAEIVSFLRAEGRQDLDVLLVLYETSDFESAVTQLRLEIAKARTVPVEPFESGGPSEPNGSAEPEEQTPRADGT